MRSRDAKGGPEVKVFASSPLDRSEEAIERQAGEWILRASERPLTAAEERQLASWLQVDMRHARIYASMSRTWSDLDGAAAEVEVESVLPRDLAVWRHRPLSAAVFAAAAAIALAVLVPQWTAPRGDMHETTIAEIRRLSLADGSVVTLGADSRIIVRFGADERRVVLESGEAFFEVAHDEARPFFVEAGDAFVRVVGTKFNVNRADAGVSVAVLEGIVRVRRTELLGVAPRGPVQELRAGDRVELSVLSNPMALSAPAAPVTPTATSPGAWRDGRLDYNDVRLGELVADLNRYYAPGVRLADPDLAELRITASFRPNEVDRILRVLDEAMPIEVSGSATGTFTLSAAAEARSAAP